MWFTLSAVACNTTLHEAGYGFVPIRLKSPPLQGSIRRILVMVDVSRLKALARDIAKLKKFVPKRCQPDQPAKNQAHQHRGTAQILGLF